MSNERRSNILLNVAVFIILEVASLCILACGSRAQSLWIGRMFHTVQAWTWGGSERFRSYSHLRGENARLATENAALLQQKTDIRALDSNRDTMWRNYPRTHFKMLEANVVTIGRGSQHNYIIIDRGAADGVEMDDGLMTSRGAIGIVQGISEHFAYAVSFANKDMVVSAKLGRQGAVGSLVWPGGATSRSILSEIPVHVPAEMGDTVFTSGFSAIFPADIPLGVVLQKRAINGSSADITVSLFEDYANIFHLMVVHNRDRDELFSFDMQ